MNDARQSVRDVEKVRKFVLDWMLCLELEGGRCEKIYVGPMTYQDFCNAADPSRSLIWHDVDGLHVASWKCLRDHGAPEGNIYLRKIGGRFVKHFDALEDLRA